MVAAAFPNPNQVSFADVGRQNEIAIVTGVSK